MVRIEIKPRAITATPLGQHGEAAHRRPTVWATARALTHCEESEAACSSLTCRVIRSIRLRGSLKILRRESMMLPKYLTTVVGPMRHFPTLTVRPAAVTSNNSSTAAIKAALADLEIDRKSCG